MMNVCCSVLNDSVNHLRSLMFYTRRLLNVGLLNGLLCFSFRSHTFLYCFHDFIHYLQHLLAKSQNYLLKDLE